MSTIGRIYTKDFSKLNEEIKKLQPRWYQKWWGIFILGILAGAIVSTIFYLL